VKLVRLRSPKAACSLSYADYKPITNAAILWDTVPTKKPHMGRTGQEKETKDLNMLMCSLYRNEYRNIHFYAHGPGPGPPGERD
jgi:hypothetical protein